MRDGFGRGITSLRISVTQHCNLTCAYCHREGEDGARRTMSAEEITRIVRSMAERGVRYVKVTGGEPLMREDIVDIVYDISHVPGIKEVSMTTNGTLLRQHASHLAEAGLKRINIGCDSLASTILLKNARNIQRGLSAAKEAGLDPIKLNMVVLKGVNDHEIGDMIEFAGKQGVILQIIELIPNGNEEYFRRYYASLAPVEQELAREAELVVRRKMHGRRQYYLGHAVVEVVRPHREEFCRNCTRVRVTSDGRIKPCLRAEYAEPVGDSFDRALERALKRRVVYCESIHG